MLILITKNLQVDVTSVFRDDNGRFLLLQCNYYTYPLIIVNVYAPTSDKRSAQITFGNYTIDKLLNFVGNNIILKVISTYVLIIQEIQFQPTLHHMVSTSSEC